MKMLQSHFMAWMTHNKEFSQIQIKRDYVKSSRRPRKNKEILTKTHSFGSNLNSLICRECWTVFKEENLSWSIKSLPKRRLSMIRKLLRPWRLVKLQSLTFGSLKLQRPRKQYPWNSRLKSWSRRFKIINSWLTSWQFTMDSRLFLDLNQTSKRFTWDFSIVSV